MQRGYLVVRLAVSVAVVDAERPASGSGCRLLTTRSVEVSSEPLIAGLTTAD
jgi:hypothetical protein